jgi:hypothetical protein
MKNPEHMKQEIVIKNKDNFVILVELIAFLSFPLNLGGKVFRRGTHQKQAFFPS